MYRFLLAAALGLAAALPAAAQTAESAPSAPESYRLDVRTPTSMYAFAPNAIPFRGGSRTWSATLDGEPIGEAAFYRVVGRDDLARTTKRRHTRARVLTAVGVVAGVGGAVLIARGTPTVLGCNMSGMRGCDIFDPALAVPGAVLMAGGLVSVSLALPMSKRTVPARDAATEARRFNDAQ